jgi:hypothetical protein
VVAEGAFQPERLVLVDVALEHDLGVRRDFEIVRLALDELDRLGAEEAREHELVDVLRQRRARGVRRDRVEPERDRDGDAPVRRKPVGAAVLVDLPVHVRGVAVDLLHPVHADVAHAGARVLGDHRGQRHERRGVQRPAALDRQPVEVDVIAGQDDLLTRARADRLRKRVGDRLQLAESPHLLDDPLRRIHLEHVLELRGDVVEPLDTERHAHPPLGAELVDQQRMLGLRVLEQQRRPAGLDDAIVDLGDLEVGIDLSADTNELPLALEQRDPRAKIDGRGHSRSV